MTEAAPRSLPKDLKGPQPDTAAGETVQDGSVSFTLQPGQRLEVSFLPTGEVTLFVKHTEPTVVADQPAPEATSAPPPLEESQKQERLTLHGRIGTQPYFRVTPKGTPTLRFSLAVHDGEQTAWHTILAFNDRAEQLREQLKKGEEVDVVGYVHPREVAQKDGSKKTVNEIYAVAVRHPKSRGEPQGGASDSEPKPQRRASGRQP